MSNNVLNLKNKLVLCKWLEINTAKCADLTRAEVVALAAKELGFSLTDNNLTGAISGAGLNIKFRRTNHAEVLVKREIPKNAYTAAALRDLMRALNQPVPPYLDAVIAGQSLEVVDGLYRRRNQS